MWHVTFKKNELWLANDYPLEPVSVTIPSMDAPTLVVDVLQDSFNGAFLGYYSREDKCWVTNDLEGGVHHWSHVRFTHDAQPVLTRALYDAALRIAGVIPGDLCGYPGCPVEMYIDSGIHTITGEECSAFMQQQEGRDCDAPQEHHRFISRKDRLWELLSDPAKVARILLNMEVSDAGHP